MKFKLTIACFGLAAFAMVAPVGTALGQTKDVDELVTNQRIKQMSTYLELKDEQKEKIRPIILEEVKAIKKVREQTDTTMEQKFAKEEELRKSCMAKVKPSLTPEQYAKWEERLTKPNSGRKKK